LHTNGRQLGRIRSEEHSQCRQIRQVPGIESPRKFFSQFSLAAALMSERQQFHSDLAGLLVGKMFKKSLEGPAIFLTREELVAVDKAA